MELYILRHGDALFDSVNDSLRSLSDLGRSQTAKLADRVIDLGIDVERAYVSSYLRAQQTASIVCSAFGDPVLITNDDITPSGDPVAVADWLGELSVPSVLLVSHQPFVGSLIEYLVEGQLSSYSASIAPMMTSSLAYLSMDVVAPGCADLHWIRSAPAFE
jgi:phosphohistidine phosphatase